MVTSSVLHQNTVVFLTPREGVKIVGLNRVKTWPP